MRLTRQSSENANVYHVRDNVNLENVELESMKIKYGIGLAEASPT